MSQKNVSPFKPAFPHPGGKGRLLAHILPLVPAHKVYIEPFAGAAAVLLAKAPAALEVINDIDGDMVTFYRYVKYHREALLAELATWPGNSSRNFADMLRNPGYTDLQRAARWYWLKVSSFGAMGTRWGRERRSYHGFNPTRHGELIDALAARLAKVMIEGRDWQEVVDWYDNPEAFIFFDPPYIACGDTAYTAFAPADMRRVRDRLDTLAGKWLLTCDDSPVCREIFAGLPIKEMAIKYSLGTKTSAPKQSRELLVMHPDVAAAAANIIPFKSAGKRRAA